MSSKENDWTSGGLDRVARRLERERPGLEALELHDMKRRLQRRTRPQGKGGALRGRIIVAVLSLGLMGAGAGGVVAASGGSGSGASAAASQYKPRCGKGTHFDPRSRKCVANHHLHKCGKGTHPSHGKCVANKPKHFCGRGTHFDKKSGKCVADRRKKHHHHKKHHH